MSCKCQNNYSSYYSLAILVYDSATALPPILELSCNITIQLLKTRIKPHFGIPIGGAQMMGSPSSHLRCSSEGWLAFSNLLSSFEIKRVISN